MINVEGPAAHCRMTNINIFYPDASTITRLPSNMPPPAYVLSVDPCGWGQIRRFYGGLSISGSSSSAGVRQSLCGGLLGSN